MLARDNDISCVPFVTSMRSYCDVGDAYCDGPRGTTIPGAYLSRYGGDITDFVVSQWNASVVAANVSQTPNANGAPLDVGRGRAAFAAAAATIAGLMLAAAPGLG